ncbi:hypothetical protein [Paracoccus jiaweipingae]|uniref:hypothetical protein n=1 Tax=unclassified Paracoccus (in: a-proteobacteria) TaxID=2688777 RepID=UPI00379D7D87
MAERFEHLLEQAQTGLGTDWLSERELLAFNEYLTFRGFGVSRMEITCAEGGTVPSNFGYSILPQAIDNDDEHWMNHFNPWRSTLYVRETVAYARAGGAIFDYKVWAEQP